MKAIQVPAPIQLEITNEKVTFFKFLQMSIGSYPQFGNGLDNIEKGLRLKTIVREAEAKGAGIIYIEYDAEYDSLKAAVCDPRYTQQGQPAPSFFPGPAMEMAPFFLAVKNATQEISDKAKV